MSPISLSAGGGGSSGGGTNSGGGGGGGGGSNPSAVAAVAAAATTAAQILSHFNHQLADHHHHHQASPGVASSAGSNMVAFQAAAAAAAAAALNAQQHQQHHVQQQANQTTSPKAICAICGDKASGKHYGVHSCEGCKGFFKRTVRKDLTYTCRDSRDCVIDKRQRNRCQYCRYQKCLNAGMKREAVQEERQKHKDKNDDHSPSNMNEYRDDNQTSLFDLVEDSTITPAEKGFLDKLMELESMYYPKIENPKEAECSIDLISQSGEKQLKNLPLWARALPQFNELDLDDQVCLLRANWRELVCCSFIFRSIPYAESLLLANGHLFRINSCPDENLRYLLERLCHDVISVMKDLKIDPIEIACLKCIQLFDPDAKNLKNSAKVAEIRDWICLILSKYCKRDNYSDDPIRFAKLLMRLPPLRSWSLKGIENLYFIKAANNFDNILVETFVRKPDSV